MTTGVTAKSPQHFVFNDPLNKSPATRDGCLLQAAKLACGDAYSIAQGCVSTQVSVGYTKPLEKAEDESKEQSIPFILKPSKDSSGSTAQSLSNSKAGSAQDILLRSRAQTLVPYSPSVKEIIIHLGLPPEGREKAKDIEYVKPDKPASTVSSDSESVRSCSPSPSTTGSAPIHGLLNLKDFDTEFEKTLQKMNSINGRTKK